MAISSDERLVYLHDDANMIGCAFFAVFGALTAYVSRARLARSSAWPRSSGLAAHTASVTFNRQLCVPVQKNNQVIPDDVLNVVRWVDLEKFDIVTPASG